MSAATAPRHDDRHLETFLGECVRESLDNHMVSNAVFLCERLHAASPSEHTTHLLATCYHRAKQPHRARAVLRNLLGCTKDLRDGPVMMYVVETLTNAAHDLVLEKKTAWDPQLQDLLFKECFLPLAEHDVEVHWRTAWLVIFGGTNVSY